MTKRNLFASTAVAAVIFHFGGPLSAFAQSADSQAQSIETVVVSAEKKDEALGEVPVPVSVISGEKLTDDNQSTLKDYYNTIPGLSLLPSFEDTNFLSIRGITTGSFSNPTVGVTIDDVPFGGSTTSLGAGNVPDLDPSDLERVETLRGPQGTLYGDNSMGGQLKFVTKDPSTDGFSGRIQAGTDGVYNGAELGWNIRGAANIPLSDTLAIRVSAFGREDPGYIDNPILNLSGVNEGYADGAHLSAMWRPSDIFSLKVSALYQETTGNGTNEVDQVAGLGDLQQNAIRGTGHFANTYQLYSAVANLNLGKITLTSVTGYGIDSHDDTLDYTATYGATVQKEYGVSGASLYTVGDTQKFTQETRASIPIGQEFDLLVGTFYDNEDAPNQHQVTSAVNTSTGAAVAPYYTSDFPRDFQEYAAFTDLTYHITDQLDLQLGGRESWTKENDAPNIKSGQYTTDVLKEPSPVVVPAATARGNVFTYLVTPKYTISPDLMIYARVASGYRPGGVNVNALAAPSLPASFAPDKTKNYEIGLKGDFFDHILSIDASVYHIDWSDIQIGVLDPTTHLSYTTNGASAKSDGIELSATLKPWQGMSVSGWVTYDDAALTENFPTTATLHGQAGDRLPDSTKYSANLSLDQSFPIIPGIDGVVGGELDYVGDRVSLFQATATRQIFPAYTQVNLRAGATYDSWRANLYVNNVGDVRGMLDGGLGYLNPSAFYYIQPRTVGINLIKSF